MAGKSPEDVVVCLVHAECEDLKPYAWEGQMRATEPMSALAAAWAAEFQVPVRAVGFDSLDGKEVNMCSTPVDLGWRAGAKLELRSFPTEAPYKEHASGDAAAPVVPAATAAAATTTAATVAAAAAVAGRGNPQETRPQAEAVVMPSPPTADDATPKAAAKATAKQTTKPTPKQATPTKQATPKPTTPKAAPKATPKATATPKSEGVKQQKKATWQAETPQAAPAALPSGAGSSTGKRKTPGSPFTPSGNLPEGEEQISFQLENPKNIGSQSYDRYEKYKVARTVAEAKRLGAASGDISYDFKRGFLKRV